MISLLDTVVETLGLRKQESRESKIAYSLWVAEKVNEQGDLATGLDVLGLSKQKEFMINFLQCNGNGYDFLTSLETAAFLTGKKELLGEIREYQKEQPQLNNCIDLSREYSVLLEKNYNSSFDRPQDSTLEIVEVGKIAYIKTKAGDVLVYGLLGDKTFENEVGIFGYANPIVHKTDIKQIIEKQLKDIDYNNLIFN